VIEDSDSFFFIKVTKAFQAVIKIGILEDDIVLLKSVNVFLSNFPDVQIVFSFSDVREFECARKKGKLLTPDVVLIDNDQSGYKQNLYLLPRFLEWYPAVKLLIYTVYDDDDKVMGSIVNGAHGYLLKTSTLYDIYSAIKECWENGGFISSGVALRMLNYIQRKFAAPVMPGQLSTKQREIAGCLLQGLSYEEISRQLGISRFTVNYHVQKIFRKMMVRSRTGLIYKLNHLDTLCQTGHD
jgi:DNA-binding NarL/FixJ family response regulator